MCKLTGDGGRKRSRRRIGGKEKKGLKDRAVPEPYLLPGVTNARLLSRFMGGWQVARKMFNQRYLKKELGENHEAQLQLALQAAFRSRTDQGEAIRPQLLPWLAQHHSSIRFLVPCLLIFFVTIVCYY